VDIVMINTTINRLFQFFLNLRNLSDARDKRNFSGSRKRVEKRF